MLWVSLRSNGRDQSDAYSYKEACSCEHECRNICCPDADMEPKGLKEE